jgi:hypothetical protein
VTEYPQGVVELAVKLALEQAEAEIARLRATLREIDAMIPQYIDFVQPKIREALANEELTK